MTSRTYITFESMFITNVLSGESFVKSTFFAHLLIHFIDIASMHVSSRKHIQGTTEF